MNKSILWIVGVAVVAGGAWAVVGRKGEDEGEVEYRYEAVQKGELSRSISATGQMEALTAVDVKSKAGGKVVKLVVDEGKFVKKGDLIALIDPEDTKAS